MSLAALLFAAASAHAAHGDHAAAAGHAGHDAIAYYLVRGEVAAGRADDGGDALRWDVESWTGGDAWKIWLTSEGEAHDGHVEAADLSLLYSTPISDFWDARIGVRYDFEPAGKAWATFGVEGLAPYFFETEARVFLSEDGDLAFRGAQAFDLLITQRLVLTPEIEIEAYAQDIRERNIGAGLSHVEASLTLRYEIEKKFAPFVEISHERALGETAALRRAAGEDVSTTAIMAGVRFWF